jgi:hypothetical protein
VSILARVLLVLLTIRLLMPPGICACQWSGPAAQLLLHALGADVPYVPPAQPEPDDDHAPGCPASPLAQGMGVHPPAGPSTLDLAATLTAPLVDPTPTLPAAGHAALPSLTRHAWPAPPLFLSACALLI